MAVVYSCIFVSQITKWHKCNKRKKSNIKEQELIACWWENKNIINFRFSKLVCSTIFESQRVGKRQWVNCSFSSVANKFSNGRHCSSQHLEKQSMVTQQAYGSAVTYWQKERFPIYDSHSFLLFLSSYFYMAFKNMWVVLLLLLLLVCTKWVKYYFCWARGWSNGTSRSTHCKYR